MTTFVNTVVISWLAWRVLRFLWCHAGRFRYGPKE